MKSGRYFVVLLLAVACVVLTAALVLTTHTNQKLQFQLQAQQQALSQGILGQQAQQISGGVLQDLAGAAAGSPEIRQLMEKHGYRVSPARSAGPAVNAEAPKP
jgi:negative regulator of sigma E activity